MKHIPVKYQLTLGLICILVSVMSIAGATGLAPDERAAILRGRGQVASSLAVQTSVLLNKQEHKTLATTLEAIVERNDEIISAAIRSRTGRIESASGEHKRNWEIDENKRLFETHMSVPMRVGNQTWGQLEVRFKPLYADRPTAAWISPKYLYLCLVAILCVVAFAYYLGKVLKQLDPSSAVPRRVEEALNTLAEGLILTDKKGRIRLANEAFSNWVGRDARKLVGSDPETLPWSRGTAGGTTTWDNVANGGKIVMPWDKALKGKKMVTGTLLRLPNKDGKMMTLVANCSPIIGAKGEYAGVLTSFEDVTDLERHKVDLARAKMTADNANQAKSEFLARMSHEIRTPMNAILGYAEVLRENMEEDPTVRQKHLTTIHSSGEHLLALINDILDLSKIESGQMTLEQTPISIFNLMQEVVSVLKMKADDKGIFLRAEYGTAMPVSINTDSVRLRQSIINLVGNAIKFTDKGGVTIRTELVRKKKSMMLSVSVQDTGIGMTSEACNKIFQPFSQADTSITRRFGGTGLGLAICKELAEKMGGSITVDSVQGEGSTFNLMIDIGDISGIEMISARDAEKFVQKVVDDDREVDLPPMHVLIVDDGETNRRLVSVFLRRANATFDIAENGKIAVDKINAGNFDAVLMDMHMPVMDGFQATRLLRQQGNQIPIIALTANAMPQDKKDCVNAGCSGFLSKPINKDRLLRELSLAVCGTIKTRAKQQNVVQEVAATTTADKAPTPTPQPVKLDSPPLTEKKLVVETDQMIGSTLPMDDEDFVYVATLFTNSLNTKVEGMVNALVEQNFEELFTLGHWLKGASGSAGYQPLHEPGLNLESAAKDEDLENCLAIVREICEMSSRVHVNSGLEHA